MAKAKDTTAPAFDVSQTDKRNDKRVALDYVFAQRFAPELLPIFAPYSAELDEQLATEGIQEIHTAVDTAIKAQVDGIKRRYEGVYNDETDETEGGEYSDYQLRGNAASFFMPKSTRAAKTPQEKAAAIVAGASEEQLAALQAILAERGLSIG